MLTSGGLLDMFAARNAIAKHLGELDLVAVAAMPARGGC